MNVVVGAVIIRGERVLAARRTRPVALAGLWEFPGGKVEAGEAPRDALVREILEELTLVVELGDEVLHPDSPWRISDEYVLRLFLATETGGELTPGDTHDELRWLLPDEFNDVEWLPSDRLALDAVRAVLGLGIR